VFASIRIAARSKTWLDECNYSSNSCWPFRWRFIGKRKAQAIDGR
jgi:hypothetical protein